MMTISPVKNVTVGWTSFSLWLEEVLNIHQFYFWVTLKVKLSRNTQLHKVTHKNQKSKLGIILRN